jgi:hypothetical protein
LGAVVGGGLENVASGAGATVAGGGWDGAGFAGNQALATASAIGGGSNNIVTTTAIFGVVAGGQNNAVTGQHATVGGGRENTASFFWANVSGGFGNTASGEGASVLGGRDNDAAGAHSLAAGRNAQALHAGALVWNCDGCPATSSGAIDQFVVNAEGGFWFGGRGSGSTSGPTGLIAASHFISTSTGAYLSDSGVWSDVSDRNAKTAFAPIDGLALLEALMGMPIESWSYKIDEGVRHIGPTAQDFHAAFGVGEDDTHLAALDTSGVALAAIQGLASVVEAKDREIAALRASNGELLRTQADMNTRLAKLEADIASSWSTAPLALMLFIGLMVGAAICAGGFVLGRRQGN